MPYAFANGAGTEADPYQVATAADLNGVRDYLTAHFIQTADIDLSGYTNWVPIGELDAEFKGGYDGDNHNITGLTINLPDVQVVGLFYHLLGTSSVHAYVKNLRIIAPVITGYRGAAPLAGKGTFCDLSNIMVTDVTIESTDDRTSYDVYAAGLLGYSAEGVTFSKCCVVGGTITAVEGCSGGLVGLGSVVTAENCYSVGIICGAKEVGGLAGVIVGSPITNCYAANSVTGSDDTGGLIGYYYPANCTVTSSYYDSTISGQSDNDGRGTPKTTAEMKEQSTYADWDFTDIWGIDSAINDGYPYLLVFESESYDFQYGSGTELDPYQVWTSNDLNGVRDYLDAHFIQMADIDLVEWANWIPIGSMYTGLFSGVYDGNGFTISNLKCNNDFASGLFMGIQNGTVKKLGVTNCDIKGDLLAGAISAWLMDNACIDSCFSTGIVSSHPIVNIGLGSFSGGIVGSVDSMTGYSRGIISNCFSKCTVHTRVEITAQQQSGFAGGIVGGFGSATLENCFSIGLIDVGEEEYYFSGGLIGQLRGGNPIVTNSYYDSETSGQLDDDGRGTPKTTSQMKLESTYVGWDFDTVWGIDSSKNDGYPYLRVFDKQDGISLNISTEGNGVTTPSAGTSYYEEGTKVLLTAKPGEGNKFIRWEGEGIEDTGGRVTRITMNGNKTVKAVFGEAVTLNLIAAGGGTTIPAPGKLTFAKGDVISLKGVPHKGFKFKEWMGDIIHTHDVQQFIIYDDMMVRAVFEEADEERRSPKRLYFATVKEKAFWRVDGKWRFFATPVHGNLKKLSTDDHKQYLTAERHDNTGRHTLGEVIPHDSHMNLLDRGIFTHLQIDNHLENLSNPHKVTAEQIGGASYESGPALPEPSEDYKGCFFSLIGDGVDEKLYYCRLKSDGETYEWKEIF